MHPVRTQARALLVHEGHVALIHVRRNGLQRWVLPGGGQDEGETLPATVAREVREELDVAVDVGPLCLVREFVPHNHDPARRPFDVHCIDFVFRCMPAQAVALDALPLAGEADREALEARWVPLAEALHLPLYPECLRTLLPRLLDTDTPHYVGDAL